MSISWFGMSETQDATTMELFELGIFVHDYELYTATQMNQIIPVLKYIPRFASGSEEVGLAS
jgi:hypothetical protein